MDGTASVFIPWLNRLLVRRSLGMTDYKLKLLAKKEVESQSPMPQFSD
jgi:hypothetical protein